VYTLWETPGGNLLAGALVISFCVAFDTASFLLFRKEPLLSRYGLIFVILGNSFMLGRQVSLLYAQISNRNRKLASTGKALAESNAALKQAGEKLDQKIKELTAAHTRMAISEKQYGDLFNGIRDPVAILDGNLRFKRVNHRAVELFDLEDIDLEDRSALAPTLGDRLYEGASDRESLLEQFWNSVYALKLNKAPTELEAFVWPEKQEKPIFCSLRMEYRLSAESGFEIFARAVILEKSSLPPSLYQKRQVAALPGPAHIN
jgi:PAS domain-containing protein